MALKLSDVVVKSAGLSSQNRLSMLLVDNGFVENYNFPFVVLESDLKIVNSLNREKPYMRDRNSFYVTILQSANMVLSLGEWSCKIFEFGKIYEKNDEYDILGILMCGKTDRVVNCKQKIYDFIDFKSLLADLGKLINITNDEFDDIPKFLSYGVKYSNGFAGRLKYNVDFPFIKNAYYAQFILDKSTIIKSKSKTVVQEVKQYNYKDISVQFNDQKKIWSYVENILVKTRIEYSVFDCFVEKDKIRYGISFKIPENRDIVKEISYIEQLLIEAGGVICKN